MQINLHSKLLSHKTETFDPMFQSDNTHSVNQLLPLWIQSMGVQF